ncbi:hypothetical protein GCM10012285_09690 [Streptomyces kronopolitis]|uniref:Uncharacterized protein n=1 Tax=Streptomyces kronopolitis TaxID=1612435 RepID=A0ABQ2J289_9ACTN|nr:hypothetical protein GCM10012285_09690 [Streptomyces kronopolitis]
MASAVTPAAMASCTIRTWENTFRGQPRCGRRNLEVADPWFGWSRRSPDACGTPWGALLVGEESVSAAGSGAGPEGSVALGRGTESSFSPIRTNSKRVDGRAGNPHSDEFGACSHRDADVASVDRVPIMGWRGTRLRLVRGVIHRPVGCGTCALSLER